VLFKFLQMQVHFLQEVLL